MDEAFSNLIRSGTAMANRVFGEDFFINGMAYTGVFSPVVMDSALLPQGFANVTKYTLKASLAQFEVRPAERSTIVWNDVEWYITQDMQPWNQFSFVAEIIRRSEAEA